MNHSGKSKLQRHRARSVVYLNSVLDKKLLAYLAAAGAGLGATLSRAEAKIIYTPVNTNVVDGLSLDLNHDGIPDYKFGLQHTSICLGQCTSAHPLSVVVEQFGKLNIFGSNNNQIAGQGIYASALLGTPIGPNANFPGGNEMVSATDINSYPLDMLVRGPWKTQSFGSNAIKNRSIGFKLKIGNETHYGWARLNVSTTKGAHIKATLTGYAYETVADKPLRAGIPGTLGEAKLDQPNFEKTPSPATLGVLARGATPIHVSGGE